MVIKTLDKIVNAVPDSSSSIARKLLVDDSRKFSFDEETSIVTDIIFSRILGYFGGVGMQAATIGGIAGYETNSILLGIAACGASAAIPVAVKATKLGTIVLRAKYFDRKY
ncbi:Uncharacterised protein [uncultured archaeon]|nr:Uncharacterised protein [uncultured archaeon]